MVFVAVGQPGDHVKADGESAVVEPLFVLRLEDVEKFVLLDRGFFELDVLFVACRREVYRVPLKSRNSVRIGHSWWGGVL